MGKNLGFLDLGTPKTAFLMRNLPIDSRNLGIFAQQAGSILSVSKIEQRRPPPPPC